jgi:hypothetical protein
MKKQVSRDLVFFIILIPLFLWGIFYFSSRIEGQLPNYSVLNKGRMGYSIFFEALKELGYSVDRTMGPVEEQEAGSIQIAAQAPGFNVNSDEILAWVETGGTLVYLTPMNIHNIWLKAEPIKKGHITIYDYGRGRVIACNAEALTNKTLIKDSDGAYELLQELHSYHIEKLYFNETHMFSAVNQKTLWDYVPISVKYIIYQLIIILAAFFYYKGKRFGKTIPLYEEVERSENEYLYSAASLYSHAGAWDLIIENYYKDLLKQLNCSHENWLQCWESENLPHLNAARKVQEFMSSRKKKSKVKENIQIVTILEQLRDILKKRRDSYWKTLKRTQ